MRTLRWGYAARKVMQIHEPQETGSSPESQWTPRTGSLYEDTPLFGEASLFFLFGFLILFARRCRPMVTVSRLVFAFSFASTTRAEDPKSKHKRPTVHDVFQLPRHPAPSR